MSENHDNESAAGQARHAGKQAPEQSTQIKKKRRPSGITRGHVHSLSESDEAATLEFMTHLIDEEIVDKKWLCRMSSSLNMDDNLHDYMIGYHPDTFNELDFDCFEIRPNRISTVQDNKCWTENVLPKVFFLLFVKKYGKEFEEVRINTKEKMHIKEDFVAASGGLFYGSRLPNAKFASALRGRYRLFRPSPFNPDEKVALCELIIGIDAGSKFDIEFISVLQRDADRSPDTHTTKGKIVLPDQSAKRFHAVCSSDGGDYFFFSFDEMNMEVNGYDDLGGIIVASYGASPASSWPFFAERISDDEIFIPKELSYSEVRLPKGAENRFKRGWIDWDPERFLAPRTKDLKH